MIKLHIVLKLAKRRHSIANRHRTPEVCGFWSCLLCAKRQDVAWYENRGRAVESKEVVRMSISRKSNETVWRGRTLRCEAEYSLLAVLGRLPSETAMTEDVVMLYIRRIFSPARSLQNWAEPWPCTSKDLNYCVMGETNVYSVHKEQWPYNISWVLWANAHGNDRTTTDLVQ